MTPDKLNQGKTPVRAGALSSTVSQPALPSASELRRRTLPSALGNAPANRGPPSSLSSDSLSTAAIQRAQFLSSTPVHRPSINGQSFSSEYRQYLLQM